MGKFYDRPLARGEGMDCEKGREFRVLAGGCDRSARCFGEHEKSNHKGTHTKKSKTHSLFSFCPVLGGSFPLPGDEPLPGVGLR